MSEKTFTADAPVQCPRCGHVKRDVADGWMIEQFACYGCGAVLMAVIRRGEWVTFRVGDAVADRSVR